MSGWGAVIQVVNSARKPSASDPSLSKSMNGSRSDTASARSSSVVRAASRNPASASNGCSATNNSGL
ncbi:Uncharacterised protein [Mycobacterium tuberculosis]|uniref:Uncharacterized protein n=1 Tax=Mycobacterium tuberculosis TaxID=1773 RepID=A0A654U1N6_MYCTX|nr:Uncharacterised protein [Mycobacterium tuberculosis]CNV92815.1 Uncharacterised protein [Mycobacterium tuberculosis]CNW57280.1 Uncharacterised protein [Mycobacterium tuberculosis]